MAPSAVRKARTLLSKVSFQGMLALDSAIVTVIARTPKGTGPHILIPAPGAGNVGDQAMLDTFAENVHGDILILTASEDALTIPDFGVGRRRQRAVPGLTHGRGIKHLTAVATYARALRSARSVTVTGADVMDGGYSAWPSVTRWSLATAAAKRGIDSRILGFSWNAAPDFRAARAMRRASASGVTMLARDPFSAARLRADGSTTVVDTADSVFGLTRTDMSGPAYERVRAWKDEGRKVALVNASGLVARKVDQPREYEPIIRWLKAHDFEVLLVPHVDRGAKGDVPATEAVRARVADLDVSVALPMLSPAGVRAVAGLADIVVTGRMHLSIMALSENVPAIIVATQGKVEGLLDMFGLPQYAVAPTAGLGDRTVAVLEEWISSADETAALVTSGAVVAKDAAERNFSGLR